MGKQDATAQKRDKEGVLVLLVRCPRQPFHDVAHVVGRAVLFMNQAELVAQRNVSGVQHDAELDPWLSQSFLDQKKRVDEISQPRAGPAGLTQLLWRTSPFPSYDGIHEVVVGSPIFDVLA